METTGIILAAVDTDHANIESWNRWYDLEHLPPNIALDGGGGSTGPWFRRTRSSSRSGLGSGCWGS